MHLLVNKFHRIYHIYKAFEFKYNKLKKYAVDHWAKNHSLHYQTKFQTVSTKH